jgi:hypothetical protein
MVSLAGASGGKALAVTIGSVAAGAAAGGGAVIALWGGVSGGMLAAIAAGAAGVEAGSRGWASGMPLLPVT